MPFRPWWPAWRDDIPVLVLQMARRDFTAPGAAPCGLTAEVGRLFAVHEGKHRVAAYRR
jgi:hypothetical protein